MSEFLAGFFTGFVASTIVLILIFRCVITNENSATYIQKSRNAYNPVFKKKTKFQPSHKIKRRLDTVTKTVEQILKEQDEKEYKKTEKVNRIPQMQVH